MTWRILAIAGISALGTLAAQAADMQKGAPKSVTCAPYQAQPNEPEMPGGDIFGFTSGTSSGDPCIWSYSSENSFRAGRADGNSFALNHKSSLSYTFNDRFALAGSFFLTHSNWANMTVASNASPDGATARWNVAFDGLSIEPSLLLLRRGPNQPFAIKATVEPRWSRVDGLTGLGATGYSAEFKLFTDVVITRDLYAAVNTTYSLGTQRLDFPGSTNADASTVLTTAALTYRLHEAQGKTVSAVFAGVEGRYRATYTGTGLNQFAGQAFHFGPTFAVQFYDNLMLNVVWTPQLTGRAATPTLPGRLDLDNFDAHEFRVKLSVDLH